jgi:hypothetical protein
MNPGSYAEKWRDYRRRKWFVYASGAGGFALLVLLMFVSSRFAPCRTPATGNACLVVPWVFGIAWLVTFAVATMRAGSWRCPRCGNLFFSRGLGSNPLARRCMHCALPKWARDTGDPS